MKNFLILTLILVFISACTSQSGVGEPTTPSRGPASQAGSAGIVFTRSGGIAGRTETWTLQADGSMIDSSGKKTSLSPNQVTSMIESAKQAGFFSFKDNYAVNSQCADCYEYTLTISDGTQTKTVITVDAAPDAPAELSKLIDQILQLTSTP